MLIHRSGLRPDQVVQVRGYADHNLRKPLQPEDAFNRRITVIIQYVVKPDPQPAFVSNGNLPTPVDPTVSSAPAGKTPKATAQKP